MILSRFVNAVDTVTELAGKASAWALFAIGLFITYEVAMRYVFNSPTIWVDEISRVLQVWVVFMSMAYVLKHKEMITIDIILRNSNSTARRLVDSFGILFMMMFIGVAAYYGFQLWLKYTLAGHTTDTYLAPPKWFTHAPVWVGGVLLMVQGLAQLVRIWSSEFDEEEEEVDLLGGGVH